MRRPSAILLAALFLGLVVSPPLLADGYSSVSKFIENGFPDNSDVRGRMFTYVIGAPKDVALSYGDKELHSQSGPVSLHIENRSADFVVEFINPSAVGEGPGRGSCYILRSNARGNYIQQARILLQDDPSCYLALYPSGSGTRGDVVMYGAVVKKGLYFSNLIYRILLLSFSDILDAADSAYDWGQVFKFTSKPSLAYAADLRSAGQPQPLPSSPSSEPIGLGKTASTGKVALAAAPSISTAGVVDQGKGSRASRVSEIVDRSASFEAMQLELGSSGETGLHEIAPASDLPYVSDSGSVQKLVYGDFPRYDAKGIALSALRSALYLDMSANPDSVYALVGDGLRATVIPSFDDQGRLVFSFFSAGKELNWNDFSNGKLDLKVRVLRLQA